MEEKLKAIIYQSRLSNRQASKAAAFLTAKDKGSIKVALCIRSTPMQIARYYLGNIKESELEKLAVEVSKEVGLIQ